MERPILFNGPMVRAILESRKTQTRRVMKPQPILGRPWKEWTIDPERMDLPIAFCPYGIPGDRLWVRETWAGSTPDGIDYRADGYSYGVDGDGEAIRVPWRPSIHMPRWASRITLEITGVEVKPLWRMTVNDMLAEGVPEPPEDEGVHELTPFIRLWDSINARRGLPWQANPWVWCIEFRRVEA